MTITSDQARRKKLANVAAVLELSMASFQDGDLTEAFALFVEGMTRLEKNVESAREGNNELANVLAMVVGKARVDTTAAMDAMVELSSKPNPLTLNEKLASIVPR